jgi:hypothetical protein
MSGFLAQALAGILRARLAVLTDQPRTEVPLAKARIPEALAYFQFTIAALQAVIDSHPDRKSLVSVLSQYVGGLLDENLQHSVSEAALQEMRSGLAALLAPVP